MVDQVRAQARRRLLGEVVPVATLGLLLTLTPAHALELRSETVAFPHGPDAPAPARVARTLEWPGGSITGQVGESLLVEATLRPAARYRNRPVLLELRVADNGSWQTVTSTSTSPRAHVAAEVPTSSAYRGQLRLRLPSHAGKAAAISRARQIRVQEDPAVLAARFEAAVLTLVNEARSQERWCGHVLVGPSAELSVDDRLGEAARAYSQRMGEEGFFGHVAPNGDTPSDRATAAGYDGPVGENIAAGQETPAEVVAGWLESPGHCANIMEPAYTVIGVGFARVPDSEYRTYWTQMFGFE